MKKETETRGQLMNELAELRQRVAELEKSESECMRAQEALRDSEEKYRDLFETAMVGLYRSRIEDGKILEANQACADIFGYDSADQFVAECVTSEHYANPARRQELLQQLSAQGKVDEFEILATRLNGSHVNIAISATIYPERGYIEGVLIDITEPKRAEEALRESEKRFRELAELLPQPVFEMDLEANFTYGNRCGFDAFGYNQDDMKKGLNALELFIPEEGGRVKQNIRKTLTGEEFEDHEYTGLMKDGSTFPVLVYSAPIIKKDKPVGVRGIVLDITERKRMEEALRESEEKYRQLISTTPDAFLVFDADTRQFIEVNEASEELYGYSREKFLNLRPLDITAEPQKSEESIKQVISGERSRIPLRYHRKKDGTVFPVEISTSSFVYKGCNVVCGVIRDITDRKRAEEAMRESVENFKALARNANDGILIAVGEGDHVYANKRAAEITGYSIAELLEIGLREMVAPDEVEIVADRFKRRLAGEDVPGQYETALVRKSGESFPVELSTARSDWEGQPASIVIIHDITKRKKAEEALRKREAELEIRTNELEEVNTALRVLLKRRNEDKTELEEKVLFNVKELVVPYVERLKNSELGAEQTACVSILESNLHNIVSPFAHKLSSKYLGLTPTEIQIANLVKQGRTTKEIAEILHSSDRTVEFHRKNIRKKIGLVNRKVNLRSHLLTM